MAAGIGCSLSAKSAEELNFAEHDVLSRKLAKSWNRYQERSLLKKAEPYWKRLSELPCAPNGKTPVWCPLETAIVIKACPPGIALERLKKMENARSVIRVHRLSHLAIPKAVLQGRYLVEQRLPISLHTTKSQIGLYIENQEKFTKAARNLVVFLSQSSLDDITGNHDIYASLTAVEIPRYDNVPLYIENNEGKIGLIDLEHFSLKCDSSLYKACKLAVLMFPYHMKDILDEADKINPAEMARTSSELKHLSEQTIEGFEHIYGDHKIFIAEQEIGLENPFQGIKIAQDMSKTVAQIITARIFTNDRFKQEFFPDGMKEETQSAVEAAVLLFIRDLESFLNNDLTRLSRRYHSVGSFPELLSARSIRCNWDQRIRKAGEVFPNENLCRKLEGVFCCEEDSRDPVSLVSTIIEEVYLELFQRKAIGGAYKLPGLGWVLFC